MISILNSFPQTNLILAFKTGFKVEFKTKTKKNRFLKVHKEKKKLKFEIST